jgi:hypothetical protein
MRMWVVIILVLLLLPIGLLAGALVMNRAPLFAPPGLMTRLGVYLGKNVAETCLASVFPELRSRTCAAPPAELFDAALAAVERLGWEVRGADRNALRIEAVVITPLWRFRDDVLIRALAHGAGSRLEVRSSSRVGRGDLAANTRHILDLHAALSASGMVACQ